MKNFYYLLFLLLLPAFGNMNAQSQPLLPDTYHWYVSTAGNDNNAGTETAPFRTIQKAITTAGTGQSIKVAPGTYQERITISGKNVVLAGNPDDPASTVIDAAQQGTALLISGTKVTASTLISGFTITGGLRTTSTGAGMHISGSAQPSMSHLIITGNRSPDGAAITLATGTANIRNSLIYGNTCGNAWGTIIRIHYRSNLEMNNSTVADNIGAKTAFSMNDSYILNIRNNIIRNPTLSLEFVLKNSTQTVDIHYCNIRGGTTKFSLLGGASSKVILTTSNITDADPLFTDAAAGNYLLSSSSPCIDAGDPSSEWNDIFLPPSLGTVRSDLGAYGGRSFEPAAPPDGYVQFTYDDSGNQNTREFIAVSNLMSRSSLKSYGAETIPFPEWDVANVDFSEPAFTSEEMLEQVKIMLYPNPTRGNLQVDITGGDIPASSAFILYGITGNVLKQQTNLSATNFMDLSSFPVGTYILRIILGDEVSVWKIIKE